MLLPLLPRYVKPLSVLLFLAVLTGTGLPTDAQAQRRDTTVVLPDIAPREVEIRGQLEIAFPSLRRQPLVGFNPPPRIPTLPLDRLPYIGEYKQQLADLPGTPLRRPDPPPALSGAAFPPAQGEVATWIGRYFSRGASVTYNTPLGQTGLFATEIQYDGTDGHQPDLDNDDLRAPSDAVEGAFEVGSYGSKWVVSFATEGYYESYTIFNARRTDPNLIPEPVRKGGGSAGSISVRSIALPNVNVEGELRYGGYKYQTRRFLNASAPGALLVRSQQHLDTRVRLDIPVSTNTAWIEGKFTAIGLGTDLDASTAASASGGLLMSGSQWRARLGGMVLASTIDDPALPTEETSLVRGAPDVRLEFFPARGVRVFAQNSPSYRVLRLDEQYRENPYLITQPRTEASLNWLDASAGVQIYAGVFQLGFRGGFQDIRQHRYLVQATAADGLDGYSVGTFFAPRFADAQVITAGSDVSVVLPGQVHLAVGATYRDGVLKATEDFIPYFAEVVGHTTLSYSFSQSKGLLQVTGNYTGSRPLDTENRLHIGPVIDIDTELSYNIGSHLGLLAHIRNISFGYDEPWVGYSFSPAVFGGGIRLNW